MKVSVFTDISEERSAIFKAGKRKLTTFIVIEVRTIKSKKGENNNEFAFQYLMYAHSVK
jgi:hypothetical protein